MSDDQSYTLDFWEKRITGRHDLSSNLVHLTRATDTMTAVEVLVEILKTKKLIAGTGFIGHNCKAVCFQDTPLTAIADTVQYEKLNPKSTKEGTFVRYSGCGVVIHKANAFMDGVRPVIYDNKGGDLDKYLQYKDKYRLVAMDLSNELQMIDWSHEREWRIGEDYNLGNHLGKLFNVGVVLESSADYKEFVKLCEGTDILEEISGIVVLSGLCPSLKVM